LATLAKSRLSERRTEEGQDEELLQEIQQTSGRTLLLKWVDSVDVTDARPHEELKKIDKQLAHVVADE